MKRGIPLHTHAKVTGVSGVGILKVLTPEEARVSTFPPASVLIWEHDGADYAGSISNSQITNHGRVTIEAPRHTDVIRPGDVIRLREDSGQISVLYRRGSTSNTLFVTEQCNSLCVMCSQPPRNEDDSWRIAELIETVTLVDKDEVQLGISGGEPTLLGARLAALLKHTRTVLPDTQLHILTNGRRFKDHQLAHDLIEAGSRNAVWAVPLDADVASVHDEIVAAEGAFTETLDGLYQLALHGARVEIRVVLHAMSISRLPQLVSYIYRRLPFIEHLALMGLEPMGFAKLNRDRLWVDPVDYMPILASAVHHADARGLAVSIYNLPLCILPRELWRFARRSISEWKNVSDPICSSCSMQDSCAGFLRSAGADWRSRAIAPIIEEHPNHEMA